MANIATIFNGTETLPCSKEGIYRELFEKRAYDAMPLIRYLRRFITENIPGTSKNLVELFAEKVSCNIAELNKFKTEMFNLVKDGMFIEFTWLRLMGQQSLTIEKDYWNAEMEQMLEIFKKQEITCKRANNEVMSASASPRDTCNVMCIAVAGLFVYKLF